MAKVILEFDIPEENHEMLNAINADNLSSIIWDLDQWLRQNYKYDAGEISVESAEVCREKLRGIMDDNGLSFNNPIFN